MKYRETDKLKIDKIFKKIAVNPLGKISKFLAVNTVPHLAAANLRLRPEVKPQLFLQNPTK